MEKLRLDLLLVQKGLCETREKAKALIMSGNVLVGTERCDKSGLAVNIDADVKVKAALPYVSRGGLKLEKAIGEFNIILDGKTCIDVGASTGGFTDCMLQNGARKVYAVDVGYGQLAYSLRMDSRVVCMERTNFRYVTNEQITELIDFSSVDVSFISLSIILPVLEKLLGNDGQALLLVKPQFEAGRGKVGKKGVVRELSVHKEVCQHMYDVVLENGLKLIGATYSPIKGPEGNIEYLYYVSRKGESIDRNLVDEMVCNSHKLGSL